LVLTESQRPGRASAAASSTLQSARRASGWRTPDGRRGRHEERATQQGADHAEGRRSRRAIRPSRTTSSQLSPDVAPPTSSNPGRQPAASERTLPIRIAAVATFASLMSAPAHQQQAAEEQLLDVRARVIDVARQDHPAGQAPDEDEAAGCRTRYPGGRPNPQTDAVKATRRPRTPRRRETRPVSEHETGKGSRVQQHVRRKQGHAGRSSAEDPAPTLRMRTSTRPRWTKGAGTARTPT